MTRIFALRILLTLCSCQISPYFIRDYSLGVPSRVTVGSALLASETGYKTEAGIVREGLKRELVYAGKTSSTLHIVYREYSVSESGSYARQAFYLNLQYDLSQSNLIRFKDFKIRIDSVDQDYLYYQVLEAPVTIQSNSVKPTPSQPQEFGYRANTRLFTPPRSATITFQDNITRKGYVFGFDSIEYAFKDSLSQPKIILIPRDDVSDVRYHDW